MMKALRTASVFTFLAGFILLSVGLIASCGSNGDDDANGNGIEEFDAVTAPTNTPEPAETPTIEPTPTEEPTPTPTPFAGDVARLQIPRFNVDSAIENIGLLPNNQMDVPKDPHNTGWYDIYDRPGWGGNSIFSAHVDWFPNIRGPFYNLARMEEGDEVIVLMEDGSEYVYEVFRKQRYHVNEIPMGDLIWPEEQPEDEEWITLITCGGEFVQTSAQGSGMYLHRDVVVARKVSVDVAEAVAAPD